MATTRALVGVMFRYCTWAVGGKALSFAPGGKALYRGVAFLIHLTGEYEVVLVDVEDRARFNYIRNYLRYLLENAEWVSSELAVPENVTRQKLGSSWSCREAGLRVLEHTTLVTDESIESVRNLPSIDRRYASYPVEDRAVVYSWVLLGKEIPAQYYSRSS